MKCIVLCAGRGTRMGTDTPKVLLTVKNRPLFQHVVDFWKPVIDDFVFVVGYKSREVVAYLPKGSAYTVQAEQKGIAHAILQVEAYVGRRFVVALGDCIQTGRFQPPNGMELGVGIWETNDKELIKRGNSAEIKNGLITRVVEKPEEVINRHCGMGTYFFDQRIFEYIRATPRSKLRNEVEITDVMQRMIDGGEKLYPVFFEGEYLNVTYPEDLKRAERLLQ